MTLEVDEGERSVQVPDDLSAALKDAGLTVPFGDLSYSHQREYVLWIEEAKRPATRERRVAETVARLRS